MNPIIETLRLFINGRVMSIEDIAKDIVFEIAYGSGRMDKSDLKELVEVEGWDINQDRKSVV